MAEHLIVLLKETSLQFQSEAEEKYKYKYSLMSRTAMLMEH